MTYKELLSRAERRSIQKEMKRAIEKAMPDPALREKVLAIYRGNSLLNELLEAAIDNPPDVHVPGMRSPLGS